MKPVDRHQHSLGSIQETVSLKFGLFYGNPRLPIHDALRSEFSMISNCCLQLADQARKAAEE